MALYLNVFPSHIFAEASSAGLGLQVPQPTMNQTAISQGPCGSQIINWQDNALAWFSVGGDTVSFSVQSSQAAVDVVVRGTVDAVGKNWTTIAGPLRLKLDSSGNTTVCALANGTDKGWIPEGYGTIQIIAATEVGLLYSCAAVKFRQERNDRMPWPCRGSISDGYDVTQGEIEADSTFTGFQNIPDNGYQSTGALLTPPDRNGTFDPSPIIGKAATGRTLMIVFATVGGFALVFACLCAGWTACVYRRNRRGHGQLDDVAIQQGQALREARNPTTNTPAGEYYAPQNSQGIEFYAPRLSPRQVTTAPSGTAAQQDSNAALSGPSNQESPTRFSQFNFLRRWKPAHNS
ncbi:hypothetical protein BT63DRAFT_450182 [Microthyrium microscopicum]|uniref:Copper acquisition factor BIM1-like domain-containing protein n=1 Tax=Microthyrium microscopicum TaxID=703497 RepID=A0A6A6UVU6_9PEZI|nr:hypothetical protein BT63DRAFT_450182 [Microthyrium microscopicum]